MVESSLDARMNEGIDRLIATLEEIKTKQGGYHIKAMTVAEVGERAKHYAEYWEYKLTDWAND
jgi:hypothetical protein